MKQDLMVLKQLPVIEENLKTMSEIIDKKVETARKLAPTEANRKAIKDARAELNNMRKEIEKKRIEFKKEYMKPYDKFDEIYKANIINKFDDAEKSMKNIVDSLEQVIKDKMEEKIKLYFEELKTQLQIDFVSYEQTDIKIGISDNETALKKKIKTFIDKVASDMQTIWDLDNSSEVLVEYKKTLDLNHSIQEVAERHKELEKIEEVKPVEKPTEKPIPKVEQLAKPKKVDTKIYTFNLIIRCVGEEKKKCFKEILTGRWIQV